MVSRFALHVKEIYKIFGKITHFSQAHEYYIQGPLSAVFPKVPFLPETACEKNT